MDMVRDGARVTGRKVRPMPAWKIEFYRQCRIWHGYLSAFAFLTLMFFSATGILLNHPEWLSTERAEPAETEFTIPALAVADALKEADPARALAGIVQSSTPLSGVYASGDIDSSEAFLRYEGVRGNTSVTIDLENGKASSVIQHTDTMTILNDLHRGKNAGAVWKWLIDVAGAIILVLSVLGYVLFFSLRNRLTKSLGLTVASIAALIGIFVVFVP